MNSRQKPKGINILGFLICVGGVMDLQNFVWVLMDRKNLQFFNSEVIGWFNFFISLPVGLLSLIVAYCFFKGFRWGRSLGFTTSLLGIAISLINLIDRSIDPIILAIITINAFTIYYLTRPNVIKYFSRIVTIEQQI